MPSKEETPQPTWQEIRKLYLAWINLPLQENEISVMPTHLVDLVKLRQLSLITFLNNRSHSLSQTPIKNISNERENHLFISPGDVSVATVRSFDMQGGETGYVYRFGSQKCLLEAAERCPKEGMGIFPKLDEK